MAKIEEWLSLIHVDRLGPATLQKLLSRFSTPENILRASRSELISLGINNAVIEGIQCPKEEAIQRDLIWLEHDNHHLLTIQDSAYPHLLKQISDPPCVLYLLGKPELASTLLSEPQLSVVGSRHASAYGKEIATSFAQNIAASGLVITSGLASGIDGAAHQGALETEIGSTIAVTACGLNRVYPAEHRQLAEHISERGLLISEFPIGTSPKPGHFPRRNRIISGLSLGTLVVEASMKSGSLITARLAIEQGREVFAIPGSIHNPLSKGGHTLIRNGAKLVETVEDVLEELKHHIDLERLEMAPVQLSGAKQEEILDPQHKIVLESMGFEPIGVDAIIEHSGLKVEVVSSILLILELNNQITHHGNGIYVRRNSP
jgi:DNA processing protein